MKIDYIINSLIYKKNIKMIMIIQYHFIINVMIQKVLTQQEIGVIGMIKNN